jgi:hypothetical protein
LEFMRGRRILEINPDHPIIKDLSVSWHYMFGSLIYKLLLLIFLKQWLVVEMNLVNGHLRQTLPAMLKTKVSEV